MLTRNQQRTTNQSENHACVYSITLHCCTGCYWKLDVTSHLIYSQGRFRKQCKRFIYVFGTWCVCVISTGDRYSYWQVIPKSEEEVERIKENTRGNFLFEDLEDDQLEKIINVMEIKEVKEGETVIVQGNPGDYFYLIKNGIFQVIVDGMVSKKSILFFSMFARGRCSSLVERLCRSCLHMIMRGLSGSLLSCIIALVLRLLWPNQMARCTQLIDIRLGNF